MKFLHSAVAVFAVCSLSTAALSQRVRHITTLPAIPANAQALPALQGDLEVAIESMKAALPIYDGYRVRSINQAHETLVLVDRAISGANAARRIKPSVTDHVGSANAHSKYTPQQIQASQTNMRKAADALAQAWKDLQSAAGSNPNQLAVKAANHLKLSQTDCGKAISIHSAQG